MFRFSPVAPATIRVQVLPVGKIERSKFLEVLRSLQHHAAVLKLADVPQIEERQLLSPKALPESSMLLNYVTFPASQQEQHLAPYELYREPLLVLGVADGLDEDEERRKSELKEAAAFLRERHPRVVHRHILMLQGPGANTETVTALQDGEANTSYHTAMCQVAGRLLVELSTYTKAMQASPTIQTPGQPVKSLQRTSSHRGDERGSASGYATPTQGGEVSSPTGEEGSRPPSRGFGSPPPSNSFEQVRNASNRANALARSDSNTSNRSRNGQRGSSQDRVSVHGFGPSTSQEKTRSRGKARVGIVTGHIYMMAGQWNEALRMLTEHTNAARKLSDSLWHAKGLDGILVCMLLLAWAEQGFSIPSVCFPSEQRSSFTHSAKLSVNLPTDFRPTEVAYQAAVGKLSMSLPELLKHILSLYRLGEGALELPPLVQHEARLRFCDLLATLYCENGELNGNARSYIVERASPRRTATLEGASAGSPISRGSISSMLAEAQPTEEDHLAATDHIQLLGGISGAYSALGMERKSGLMLRGMIDKLTTALIQARKLGAAEAGIHPAASLSVDAGADIVVGAAAESPGLQELMDKIGCIYGVSLLKTAHHDESEGPLSSVPFDFGNAQIKSIVLRALLAFCEASPDPHGVLRIASSLLRAAGAYASLDAGASMSDEIAAKDDQIRVATSLSRTVGVSRHLGLTDIQAEYWDPFLVRGVCFVEPHASRNLLPLGSSKENSATQGIPGNPLLYDPNAKRGTQTKGRLPIVRNEPLSCLVTLQNPLETPVEIEDLALATDGTNDVELDIVDFTPITLKPLCFQQVSCAVSPTRSGDFSITGCRIKVAGCREKVFGIFGQPWSPSGETLVKFQGQNVQAKFHPGPAAPTASVPMTAIESMPLLEIEHTSYGEGNMMLLDGETQTINVVLRNKSQDVAAAISSVNDSAGVMRIRKQDPHVDDAISQQTSTDSAVKFVQPGSTLSLDFDILGKVAVSSTSLNIIYGRPEASHGPHRRVASLPLHMTVDAALQAQNPEIIDDDADGFDFSFDVHNALPKPLSFFVESIDGHHNPPIKPHTSPIPYNNTPKREILLSPGETQRVSHHFSRTSCPPNSSSQDDEILQSTLLNRIQVIWRTWKGEPRWGNLDLSSHLTFTPHHLQVLRASQARLRLRLLTPATDRKGVEEEEHRQTNTPRPQLKSGAFATLRLEILHPPPSSSSASQEHSGAGGEGPLWLQLQLPQEGKGIGVIGTLYRIVSLPGTDHEGTEKEEQEVEGDEGERKEGEGDRGGGEEGKSHVDFVICPLVPGSMEVSAFARPAIAPPATSTKMAGAGESVEEGGREGEGWWRTKRPLVVEVV
ncbi:hypercellular protein-like protein HypA [Hortaea werneckii]|nr:hypercellular protein-like protein HypA [Hortaea werneckii]KAI7580547.1 hypercellular protein-like protein HypA [Hortaea werneckii]